MTTETNAKPSPAQWRELFKLGAEFYKLAPWTKLDEATNIGIEDPQTGIVGYTSFMGALGEHRAVAFYLGKEGFHGLLDLQSSTVELSRREVFSIPQVQISFEAGKVLEPEDLEITRKYQLVKPRGRNSNIVFRSVRPGCFPWFINADEAALLIVYLRQTLTLLPDILRSPDRYEMQFNLIGKKEIAFCMHRSAENAESGQIWRNEWKNVAAPDQTREFIVPEKIVRAMKKKPSGEEVEIAYFDFPIIMASKEGRPFEPEVLIIVGTVERLVFGDELATPRGTIADYKSSRISLVIDILSQMDFRPEKISIDEEELYDGLLEFCERCEIGISLEDELPAADFVMDSLLEAAADFEDDDDDDEEDRPLFLPF